MAITVKQSVTRPVLGYTLNDTSSGTAVAINLTTATSVTFKARSSSAAVTDPPKIDSAMTITNAANGGVEVTLTTTDTNTAGTYNVEFWIVWNDGGIEKVPNDGYNTLTIVDDLAADV